MSKPRKAKAGVSEPTAVGEDRGGEESGARPATPGTSPRKEPVKKPKAQQRSDVKNRAVAAVDNARQFLREVRVELTKVSWPSRRDVIASTSVVLVIVFLIAAFLGLVDLGLSRIIKLVLS
jgi:preprotein translocase subunit SecE